ncbi:MAG TPA: carboxymuconolactone decarboxylase family protein, partial [Hyphomicrobiales bacterium]|nr:carboxymuconolactone decarboxylase family protein [Hyphomicrobiales bacterium]
FAIAVTDKRGLVSDTDLAAARQAGLSDADIVETVANVVANIFTNYINHVAQTDIDFPVVRTQAA